jgi:hypothetical protein
LLTAFAWVKYPQVKSLKITFISCGDDRTMHAGGGGDHSILQKFVGFSANDPSHSRIAGRRPQVRNHDAFRACEFAEVATISTVQLHPKALHGSGRTCLSVDS